MIEPMEPDTPPPPRLIDPGPSQLRGAAGIVGAVVLLIATFVFAFSAAAFWRGCYINCVEPEPMAGFVAAVAALASAVWAFFLLLWAGGRIEMRWPLAIAGLAVLGTAVIASLSPMVRFGLL